MLVYWRYNNCPGGRMGNVEVGAAYIPYMSTSAATVILLLALLIVYWCKYHPAAPIVGILGLLLFNDMLQLAFELATYMTDPPEIVCLVSVVGTTFFRLASYYWLIFITKLIYREKASPGMEINLARKIGKNLLMAYMPSVIVSLLILVVSNLDSTQSKNNCWKIIREKEPVDYVVFLLSFVLPNLVALGVIIGYLMAYIRLMPKKHSIFLAFPAVAVPFLIYGLTVKMLTFFGIDFLNGNGELPLMVEPITHALVFILVLRGVRRVKPKMSDITLGNEQGENEGLDE